MVITLASCCLVFAGCGDKNPTVTLDKRNGEPIDTIQMQSKHYYWQVRRSGLSRAVPFGLLLCGLVYRFRLHTVGARNDN